MYAESDTWRMRQGYGVKSLRIGLDVYLLTEVEAMQLYYWLETDDKAPAVYQLLVYLRESPASTPERLTLLARRKRPEL